MALLQKTEPKISRRLTHSINIIYNSAGVATPDPGEAPPLAGFNMKSSVAYIALVKLFFSAAPCKNRGGFTAKRAESAKRWGGGGARAGGAAQLLSML